MNKTQKKTIMNLNNMKNKNKKCNKINLCEFVNFKKAGKSKMNMLKFK